MAATATIFLHAELLPNIRQLTLHVSLPNTASEIDIRESTITLSESCRAVTVFTLHQDVELVETLKLPVKVTDASRRNLSFAGHRVDVGSTEPNAQTAEYSFRLQVDHNETGLTVPNQGAQEDDYVPWTANDMSTCAALHCRFCRQMIVDTASRPDDASSWQWKDLPSGNWAEMMDFWHCHKPDVHPNEKEDQKNIEAQNASVKGYGASNRVVATPRTGLVDVASFLVAENDCQNIQVVSTCCKYAPDDYSNLLLFILLLGALRNINPASFGSNALGIKEGDSVATPRRSHRYKCPIASSLAPPLNILFYQEDVSQSCSGFECD
jgi:hypothetical protein